MQKLPLFFTSMLLFPAHTISFSHLHIHSWNNLDRFYSLHTLKKKKNYLQVFFHACVSSLTHIGNPLTHLFLQLPHPMYVLAHCFSPLLAVLFYFLTISPLSHLAACFSPFVFLNFLFYISLSQCYYYPSQYNILCTMPSIDSYKVLTLC